MPRTSCRAGRTHSSMDHSLPLHQPNTEADRAHVVRSRSTHRCSDHDIEPHGILTTGGDTVPLARERSLKRFIRRFKGEGRRVPGWSQSLHALVTSSSERHFHLLPQHASSHCQLFNGIIFCFRFSSKRALHRHTYCLGGPFRQMGPCPRVRL